MSSAPPKPINAEKKLSRNHYFLMFGLVAESLLKGIAANTVQVKTTLISLLGYDLKTCQSVEFSIQEYFTGAHLVVQYCSDKNHYWTFFLLQEKHQKFAKAAVVIH